MLRLLSSKAQGLKDFWKTSEPAILVFIGKLSLSALGWVPICHGFSYFPGILHYSILRVNYQQDFQGIYILYWYNIHACSNQEMPGY